MPLTEKEILELIGKGESQRVEFKSEPTEKIGEEICAMANAEGGIIFVGIDDDKTPVGVDPERAKRIVTSQIISISPAIIPEFQVTEISGKKILIIIVPKSDKLHMIGGRAFIRIGTSKRPLDITEILDRGSELAVLPPDSIPTDIDVSEIWTSALERFTEAAKKRGAEISDPFSYLQKIGAIRGGKLTLAGALMFLEHPQERWPHTYVRIIRGDTWKRIDGPVWEQVEKVFAEIMEHVPKQEMYAETRRIDIPALPPEVVREAVVNALVHRNYMHFSEVFVEINGRTVKIRNPGSFPPGISPEKPAPKPRNPILYELMYQMGYVERRGRGIEMIERKCREANIDVEIRSESSFTEVTFRFGPEIDERIQEIVRMLSTGPKSSADIAKALRTSRVTAIKLLKRAEHLGLVKRVGRGRSTKYVLTS